MARMISRRPDTQSGAYCIAGTRIPVVAIKEMSRVWSAEKIMREFPTLNREQIAAALAFRNPLPRTADQQGS